MTDLFDRAQALEQRQRDEALVRRAALPRGASLSHCEDCGDEIPAPRRAAVPGCRRCIPCQQDHERMYR